jgi:hypothetical protein
MLEAANQQSRTPDYNGNDDIDRLLHPAAHFVTPLAIVKDSSLSPAEKRAILSSWASDACAVEAMPALRQVPGAPSPITFDEIMDALQMLDRDWKGRAFGKSTNGQGHLAGGGGLHFG